MVTQWGAQGIEFLKERSLWLPSAPWPLVTREMAKQGTENGLERNLNLERTGEDRKEEEIKAENQRKILGAKKKNLRRKEGMGNRAAER